MWLIAPNRILHLSNKFQPILLSLCVAAVIFAGGFCAKLNWKVYNPFFTVYTFRVSNPTVQLRFRVPVLIVLGCLHSFLIILLNFRYFTTNLKALATLKKFN